MDDRYEVRYAGLPSQTFSVTYSAEVQLPMAGSFVRGSAADRAYGHSLFVGSTAVVHDPFLQRSVVAYATGRYTTAVGVIYDGEFQYLPVRSRKSQLHLGVFIFVGARIDPELDEVRTGLYISDVTDVNSNIRFHRARPDFITMLQSEYAMQLNELSAEKAADQQAVDNRRAAFGLFIDVVAGIAGVRSAQKGGSMNPFAREALQSLRGAVAGEHSPEAAVNQLMGSLVGRLGDRLLGGRKLAQATRPGDLLAALQTIGKQSMSLTVRQYEQSLQTSASIQPATQ